MATTAKEKTKRCGLLGLRLVKSKMSKLYSNVTAGKFSIYIMYSHFHLLIYQNVIDAIISVGCVIV